MLTKGATVRATISFPAEIYQTLEDIALEVRFTQIEQVLYVLYRYWHRVAEVFEHPGLQVPGVGEVFGLHRPKQIHTVAGS